jgi:hypothetical protein
MKTTPKLSILNHFSATSGELERYPNAVQKSQTKTLRQISKKEKFSSDLCFLAQTNKPRKRIKNATRKTGIAWILK